MAMMFQSLGSLMSWLEIRLPDGFMNSKMPCKPGLAPVWKVAQAAPVMGGIVLIRREPVPRLRISAMFGSRPFFSKGSRIL